MQIGAVCIFSQSATHRILVAGQFGLQLLLPIEPGVYDPKIIADKHQGAHHENVDEITNGARNVLAFMPVWKDAIKMTGRELGGRSRSEQ